MEQEHGKDCVVERIPFGKEAQDSHPVTPLLKVVEEEEQIALGESQKNMVLQKAREEHQGL